MICSPKLSKFIHSLNDRLPMANPKLTKLELIARELQEIASSEIWRPKFGHSTKGMLEEICVSSDCGPSLYFVSEVPGAIDVPHEHLTWTVIIGIEGSMENILYEVADREKRQIRELSRQIIYPGDIVILDVDAVHAINVAGEKMASCLNLYGSPIVSRPPFSARCYTELS